MRKAQFNPGRIVATPLALETFGPTLLGQCLNRHLAGDWGDLDPEDRQTNDEALVKGHRLLSSYVLPGPPHQPSGHKVWCITEADRSVTTFLLPEEY